MVKFIRVAEFLLLSSSYDPSDVSCDLQRLPEPQVGDRQTKLTVKPAPPRAAAYTQMHQL